MGISDTYNGFANRNAAARLTQSALLNEGRLPEVSRWKDTAGTECVSAYGAASFPLCAPSVVQDHQRALPMLVEGRL